MYHIFLNEKLWTGQKTGTQKNNKLNFVFRAYFITLICSLMDPLQKKRTDSYQELMVWIQMLLHPLEIGIYKKNYSATA